MGNKFTNRRRHAKRPPICLTKPPPKPYQYPPYPYSANGREYDATYPWPATAKLPKVPLPPFKPITIRNLLFHCYPNPKNTAWIQNLHEIRKRWSLFNGRRLIAIATATDLIPPHRIQNFLGSHAEYFISPNHPRLRETASFHDLLSQIRTTNSNEATFYAHSKGASGHYDSNTPKQLAIRLWRNRMYHELLDKWPKIQRHLRTAAAVGCFKIDYSCFPEHVMRSPTGLEWGTWHFAGNFYWLRHDCIFRNPHWSEIADDPYAAEMWLGNLIDSEFAQSAYQPWDPLHHPPPDLYDPNTHANPTS